MAEGPTIPDGPHLDVDPNSSPDEQLTALRDHLIELTDINNELEDKLDRARSIQAKLHEAVDRYERENVLLKAAPTYLATIEDVFDDEAVVRQHGTNQEVLVDLPPQFSDVDPATRIAVNDSFGIESILTDETDARAQAMEVDDAPNVSYADVGGLEDQIREVRETVELPLAEPERFEILGIDPPSGVLLHGPPGTGKTMLAKAVANETDSTFIRMAGSELVQKFIGEGSRLVRDLFELAEERSPAVVFIDEIDAIATTRTDSKTAGDAEVQRTMMQLLSEMDGFTARPDVRIIGATNRFDMLDRALLRPGRFDRIIEVPYPDVDGREAILQIHTRSITLDDDVDLAILADDLSEVSGADVKAICTEAGMMAIRDDRTVVTMADFRDAVEKVLEGDGPGRPVTNYIY